MNIKHSYPKLFKMIRNQIPLLLMIVVVILQFNFKQLMNDRVFILIYPILFAGIIIGPLKSSFSGLIFALLSLCYLFLEPLSSLKVSSYADILGVILFTSTGIILMLLNERQKKIYIRQGLESLEQFKDLANSMPQLAWIAKADGFICWYNERWYNYTGSTPEEMEGWGWQSVHHPDNLPEVMEKWPKSILSGDLFEMEFPLKNADGTYRWFLTRAVPIKNKSGLVIRWFGTNTDIEMQKNIQEELTQAILMREELIAVASHEFKTPITSIKMQTQMFQRQINLEKGTAPPLLKQSNYLKLISKQIEKLNRLVDELLDVSRIGSGKLEYDLVEIDLTSFTEELIERFTEDFKESGCSVSFEGSKPVHILCDKFRLEQVLINIFINAMKYASGKPVKIFVTKTDLLGEVIIEDKGLGIADNYLPLIFNKFERAITHKNISGLGLGLFIAKEMMLAQNGDIRVESKIDQGSTFYVTLPLSNTHLKEKLHH